MYLRMFVPSWLVNLMSLSFVASNKVYILLFVGRGIPRNGMQQYLEGMNEASSRKLHYVVAWAGATRTRKGARENCNFVARMNRK